MSDPTNTDANTSDMDAQTTPDAGGSQPPAEGASTPPADDTPDAGSEPAQVTLPDGSSAPVGEDGIPILYGAPRQRRLGPDNGTAAPYGLMAKRAAKRAARESREAEAAPEVAEDGGYEPADHTVSEVQAYLAENPDQTGYVLDRERGGKARVTLIGA